MSLDEIAVHRQQSGVRKAQQKQAHKRDMLKRRPKKQTIKQKQATKKMMSKGVYSKIASLRNSLDLPATLSEGKYGHRREFIDLVLEAASETDADTEWNAQDFAKFFLQKDAAYSNTDTGMTALQLETWIYENDSTLYQQFVETQIDANSPVFLAIFQGKLQNVEQENLEQGIKPFCEFKILVNGGNVQHGQGVVSDVCILECKPKKNPDSHQNQVDKEPHIVTGKMKFAEGIDPDYYRQAIAEGGLRTQVLKFIIGEDHVENAIRNGSELVAMDGNNVAWMFKSETKKWEPVLDDQTLERVDTMSMEERRNDPDVFDLEEWIGKHYPKFLKSIHYLQPSSQYEAMLDLWKKKGKPKLEAVEESMQVANTIRSQLGQKALYMIGAKNFSGTKNSLSFKMMKNKTGGNYVTIILNSMDTYDIEFISVRAGKRKVRKEFKNVYVDKLHKTIQDATGLNLSLTKHYESIDEAAQKSLAILAKEHGADKVQKMGTTAFAAFFSDDGNATKFMAGAKREYPKADMNKVKRGKRRMVSIGQLPEGTDPDGNQIEEAFVAGSVYEPRKGKRRYIYIPHDTGGGTLQALSGADKGSQATYQLGDSDWKKSKDQSVTFSGKRAYKRKSDAEFLARLHKQPRMLSTIKGAATESLSESAFNSWTVQADPDDSNKSIVQVDKKAYRIPYSLSDVEETVKGIKEFYRDLPEEGDAAIEAYMSEFCADEGQLLCNEDLVSMVVDKLEESGAGYEIYDSRDSAIELRGKMRLASLGDTTQIEESASALKKRKSRVRKQMSGVEEGKKFPKFVKGKAKCFNCGASLPKGKDSGNAPGEGKMSSKCHKCKMTTFYDIKESMEEGVKHDKAAKQVYAIAKKFMKLMDKPKGYHGRNMKDIFTRPIDYADANSLLANMRETATTPELKKMKDQAQSILRKVAESLDEGKRSVLKVLTSKDQHIDDIFSKLDLSYTSVEKALQKLIKSGKVKASGKFFKLVENASTEYNYLRDIIAKGKVDESLDEYGVPVCSTAPGESQAQALKDAPERLKALTIGRTFAHDYIDTLYKSLREENPNMNELLVLAKVKRAMNSVNIYDAFRKYAEDKGLADPNDLGIYEHVDDETLMLIADSHVPESMDQVLGTNKKKIEVYKHIQQLQRKHKFDGGMSVADYVRKIGNEKLVKQILMSMELERELTLNKKTGKYESQSLFTTAP